MMPAKRLLAILVGTLLGAPVLAADVFRKPFDLHLEVDREGYYEEHFEHVPYVSADVVYLFKGDEFGVTLSANPSGKMAVAYQPDLAKADVTFKLRQIVDKTGRPMMMLTIVNRTRHAVAMDALMTVPGESRILRTTIARIPAGLIDYESWPQPIVQLCLLAFRAA